MEINKFNIINLAPLMNLTSGSPTIKIGLIDGPVLISHTDINIENVYEVPGDISSVCKILNSVACNHGTFIAGILKGKRGSIAPAICPDCTLLMRPIFTEEINSRETIPSTTPQKLASAIFDCIYAGARIINLSLALAHPSSKGELELEDALNYAAKKGVIIVAAAGNQGTVGSTAITRHPWVIPVVACDNNGKIMQLSNLGNSVGRNGLSAPGENIVSLGVEGIPVTFSGTSAAAPFVTGAIALLWSQFPNLEASIIKHAIGIVNKRRSIVPPIIDAMLSFEYLKVHYPQKLVA